MKAIQRPINAHPFYHAHVYFEQDSLSFASGLCKQVGETFGLKIGRIHQQPVGPHPQWSCQILFDSEDFDTLIPWLEANRKGLSILVHALTGNDLADHTKYAYWLGDSHALNLKIFGA